MVRTIRRRAVSFTVAATIVALAANAHADSDDSAPIGAYELLVAGGSLVAAGGIATATGTSVTLAGERDVDWEISSYVLGSLNGLSSAIYIGIGGENDQLAELAYPISIVNGVVAVTNFAVAIASSHNADEQPADDGFVDLQLDVKVMPDVAGTRVPRLTLTGRW